jgi:hypothetical protein
MNQNDLDRYFWRTGQRWSGDDRPRRKSSRRSKLHSREILFLCLVFIATLAGLVLLR